MPDVRSDGTGASIDNGYDAIGRLASQAHAFDGGVGNLAFTFGYNPASQIVTRTRSNDAYVAPAPAATDAYTADSLNRIAAVDGAAFGYDANGNLTSQPASVTGAAARTFSYDVENRLVGSSDGVVLHYDPLGRLYQISGGPTTRRLVWDGDALIAEYNQVNTLTDRYAHGGAAGVDDPLIWNRSGAYRRLHGDHQGSIVAITDGAGANYAINRYDEWGVPVEPLVGRFGYTGQIWIAELGLWHYKARMYSPYIGRFMQVDPVGYEDQVNLYAYVGNDPVNAVDSTGLSIDTCGSRVGISATCSGETLLGRIESARSRRTADQAADVNSRSSDQPPPEDDLDQECWDESCVPTGTPRPRPVLLAQSRGSNDNWPPEADACYQARRICVGNSNAYRDDRRELIRRVDQCIRAARMCHGQVSRGTTGIVWYPDGTIVVVIRGRAYIMMRGPRDGGR